MNRSVFLPIGFVTGFLFLSLCFCGSIPSTLLNFTPAPLVSTPTPKEDATAAAIATDVGAGPMVDWISTVNAMGTQGTSGSNAYDGEWNGTGAILDGSEMTISLKVANGAITDITVGYHGTGGVSCTLRGSATDTSFKVQFLPVAIDSLGSVNISDWGLSAHFFPNNDVSGSIGTTVSGQTQRECNVEIKGAWDAKQ